MKTFLVDRDFQKSAKMLDNKRLGKQRVEAYQLLRIIRILRKFHEFFSIPHPKTRDQFLYNIDLYIKQSYIEFYFDVNDNINYRVSLNKKLGFARHPEVWSWYHHPDSLKHYINCHIEQWIERGFKNTMDIYQDVENSDRPKWTFDEKIFINHKQSLLKKEIERKEKDWYINLWPNIGQFDEYIWPDAI